MKEDKVLLGKRKGSHGEGYWAFPGGHIEYNETIDSCVNREIKEETYMRVALIDKFPVAATNDLFIEEGKQFISTKL